MTCVENGKSECQKEFDILRITAIRGGLRYHELAARKFGEYNGYQHGEESY